MSDKTKSVGNKNKVGILRKRDSSLVVPNNPIKQRIPVYTPKSKGGDSLPSTARSLDDDGSLFSNRTKIIRKKQTPAPVTAPGTPRTRSNAHTGDTITACPSTLTIDSHFTTTSHSSLSHKPGFIPAYLRNKTGTKNLVAIRMLSNKTQFIQIKKELVALQNKAVEYYKRYRESVVKLNKLNGNDKPPDIEELQMVAFKETSAVTAAPPILLSTELKLTANMSLGKLKQITDEQILSDISQQVHSIQVHSFKLVQEFSDRLALIKEQMNLTENSAGGDQNLLPAQIQNFFEEIGTKILEEKEQQGTRIMSFMSNLKQVMVNEESTVEPLEEGICDEYENIGKPKNVGMEVCKNQLKRDIRDKKIEILVLKLEQSELANKRLKNQFEDKTLEVIAKEKLIMELKGSIKSRQEKMMSDSDEFYKNQLDRLKTKYDEEVKLCKELRVQVNNLNLSMATDSRKMHDDNIKLKNSEKVLMKEVDRLKLSLSETPHKNSNNEPEDDKLNELKTTIIEIKEELRKRESQVTQKNQEISDLKIRLESYDEINGSEEQNRKLQELNIQKSKEIEQLQNNLTKSETALRLQEESLVMQQRLLKIRSELLQSLQENEDSTKNQISELNSEVERMACGIKQLNQEVSSKTEELENLFSTLGVKNLEVKRQDHLINMLEETYERNKKIRFKLEAKIVRLENENDKLKRFLVELNIPLSSSCTITSVDDATSIRPYNSGFFENLRRKKRYGQTSIKVKKYNN